MRRTKNNELVSLRCIIVYFEIILFINSGILLRPILRSPYHYTLKGCIMRTEHQIPEQSEEKNSTRRGFLSKLAMSLAGISFLAPFIKGEESKQHGVTKTMGDGDYIGEIMMVAFDYAPMNYLPCDGRTLNIASYNALYALIGTRFGGNGTTTFNLPDLRGRIAVGMGQGTGLTNRIIGAVGGAETHLLSANEMPVHTHSLPVNTGVGNTDIPNGTFLARNSEGVKQYSNTPSTSYGILSNAGNGQSHNNMPPFVTMNFVICYNGIYPTRP